MNTKNTRRGFTLIELLVVVLIIGVLAAIALPMYQKAVMKSRFAALMPIAKSMADSNEAYYLEHNTYASNPQDLLVQGQEEYPTGTEVELAPGLEYAYVMVSNALAHNNYIVYQKHSNKFPDNIHCEALEDDAQANEICVSLGGTPISGSLTDGYKTYVLSGTQNATDKLPTSISKLKSQICGTQFTGADCIVDEENNTITTQECEGSFSNGSGTRDCIKRTYDDTAAPTNYVRENVSCSYTSGSYPQTTCYTYKYNEAGTKLPGYTVSACRVISGGHWTENGECIRYDEINSFTGEYYVINEYDSNGQMISQTRYTCTEVAADGTCANVVTTTY